MLTREDNDLLTKVSRGTPMGDFMREYWIPACLSVELPEPDGEPLRVRLLGEDLIAFRDTDGQVGLVGNNCPHRGASMFFGRNEESGLRCVYHGWKFDHTGTCVDMPNEPPESNFKHKVKITAYPCQERNGVVWTYMGPRSTPPGLPHLEWNMDPDNIPWMWQNYRACNWMQAIEGGIDSSHVNFLHRTFAQTDVNTVPGTNSAPRMGGAEIKAFAQNDSSPRLEIVDTPYGAIYTGARKVDDSTDYHRIHPFMFPNHNMIGGGVDEHQANYLGMVWVPMDDHNTLVLEYQWRASGPYSEEEQAQLMKVRNAWGFASKTTEPAGAWKFRANASNDYLIDYELQKTKLFCGIQGNPLQDGAVQESMGPIYDRTKEHLGTADAMIIRVRRLLLQAVKAYQQGATPPGVDHPEWYAIRPVGALLPPGVNWVEATAERRRAFYRPGVKA